MRVPPGPFDVEAVDVAAVLWRCGVHFVLRALRVPDDSEVEGDVVERDLHFPRVVLQHAGQEGLRVKEGADPELGRNPVLDPRVDELDSLHERAQKLTLEAVVAPGNQ